MVWWTFCQQFIYVEQSKYKDHTCHIPTNRLIARLPARSRQKIEFICFGSQFSHIFIQIESTIENIQM